MKLSFDFDIDDWTTFQRYHYSVSPTYRRMRNYTRILFPVAALLIVACHFQKHGLDYAHIGVFAFFSVLWFVYYTRLLDRRLIKRSKQFLREGNTETMFGHREVELLPDTIHVISSSADTTYRASSIAKTVETPDALLLYVAPMQAVILPKRKLSEEEFQQATAFARQHYANQIA